MTKKYDPIIKLEHIAEALTAQFFQTFLEAPGEDKFQAYNSEGTEITLTPKSFREIYGDKMEVKPQFPLNQHFKVSDFWKNTKLKVSDHVELDEISCFDCALLINNEVVLPIEVKSGNSDIYRNVNQILKNSFYSRSIDKSIYDNHTYLKGDMISILAGPVLPTDNKQNKTIESVTFEKKRVLESISNIKLHDHWILVCRTNDHLGKGRYTPNSSNRLNFIFTLENMIQFLIDKKILKKDFKPDPAKSLFENRLMEDISFWLTKENLYKIKESKED